MSNRKADLYAYLAFDRVSEVMLAHGPTAALALRDADQVAPDAEIYILDAGAQGQRIWALRLDLFLADELLADGPVYGFA